MAQAETLWLWRAWSADRSRICDCGVVRAVDAARASGVASMCLGGPWMRDVVEIEVEDLAQRYPQTHANTLNAAQGGE